MDQASDLVSRLHLVPPRRAIVIDANGRLLGMVTGRDSELGVAVPAEPIERLLSQYGSTGIASTPPAALPINIADLLIVMSVLVLPSVLVN